MNWAPFCLTRFKQFFTLHTCMQKLTLFGLQSLHPFSLFSLLTTRASESAFEIFAPLSFFLVAYQVLFPILNNSSTSSYHSIQLPSILIFPLLLLPNSSFLLLSLSSYLFMISFVVFTSSSISLFPTFHMSMAKRLSSTLTSMTSEIGLSHAASLQPLNITF